MKKKIYVPIILLAVIALFAISMQTYKSINAKEEGYENFDSKAKLDDEAIFTNIDENGNITTVDISALEEETQEEINNKELIKANTPRGIGGARAITNGVVNFKTKANSTLNTYYIEDGSNRSGYTNGYYGADGAFLGYNADATKVKFMQAGTIGWVNASEVEIIDYDTEAKSVNYYKVSSGKLLHYITNNIKSPYYSSSLVMGYKPTYLQENGVYYSYDGHYFYATYAKMISDYKNNTRNNAINATNPYYNYYQYLSHRSTTKITADMMNAYINTQASGSKMSNMGKYFIDYQNQYGSNALLMLGVAANESAWGTSDIAKAKNNLFGHAAYDTSAGDSATGYYSPEKSIYSHARYFVSEGYLDPKDTSGRYYGAHLGDKASGMSVKYASDPYWGEKNAAIAWNVSMNYASTNDSTKYTLAIKDSGTNVNVRKETTSASNSLYMTGSSNHYPVIVLATVNGQSVNKNTAWYKIPTDPTLNDSRTAMTQDKGEYNFNLYYGYISSEYATIVGTEKQPPSGVKGDVNGDGQVSPTDYVLVRNHINGKSILSQDMQTRADINDDNQISPTDYVLLRKMISSN